MLAPARSLCALARLAPLFKNSGFAPEPIVSAKIFSSVIRPTLLYGCPSIYMSETNIENLNRCQAKLIKSCLGLKPQTHSTLLLEALNVLPIKRTLFVYSLDLMRSCLLGNSQSNTFYNYLIKNGMKIKISNQPIEHWWKNRGI